MRTAKGDKRWILLVFLGSICFSLYSSSRLIFPMDIPATNCQEGETLPVECTPRINRSDDIFKRKGWDNGHNRARNSQPGEIFPAEYTPPPIDWSDDIFKRKGWDNDPIVIESHKLLFFAVPKNACTTFKKLFRRMMGKPDWLEASAHDPEKNGLKYLGNYTREQQEEFMTSPEWTRAIFVRDPIERALSAYMDKGLLITHKYWQPPVTGAYIKRVCCLMTPETTDPSKLRSDVSDRCTKHPLWPYETNMTIDNFPFESFVDGFLAKCRNGPDPHWKAQYDRMNEANWAHINFVGRFETKKADTHRLLKQIGAFDEYGSSGWGEDASGNMALPIFETNLAPHKTDSGAKIKKHYTEKMKKVVLKFYSRDYESVLFNFTKP